MYCGRAKKNVDRFSMCNVKYAQLNNINYIFMWMPTQNYLKVVHFSIFRHISFFLATFFAFFRSLAIYGPLVFPVRCSRGSFLLQRNANERKRKLNRIFSYGFFLLRLK